MRPSWFILFLSGSLIGFVCSQTLAPTTGPTTSPTTSPTANPTVSPTTAPSANPTVSPTTAPSASPTVSPTAHPTTSPTVSPTSFYDTPAIPWTTVNTDEFTKSLEIDSYRLNTTTYSERLNLARLSSVVNTSYVLFTTGYVYRDSVFSLSTCARLCNAFNQHLSSVEPCVGFNKIYETFGPGDFACELLSIDAFHDDADVVSGHDAYFEFGWFNNVSTPIANGVFMTPPQLELYQNFTSERYIACNDTYSIGSNNTITTPEMCAANCTANHICGAFTYYKDATCTYFSRCHETESVYDTRTYSRTRFGKDNIFDVSNGVGVTGSGLMTLIEVLTNVTLHGCAEECFNTTECAYLQVDEKLECRLFEESSDTIAASQYTTYEPIRPATPYPTQSPTETPTDAPSCLVDGCQHSGSCVNAKCVCSYPYYGEFCENTLTCVC